MISHVKYPVQILNALADKPRTNKTRPAAGRMLFPAKVNFSSQILSLQSLAFVIELWGQFEAKPDFNKGGNVARKANPAFMKPLQPSEALSKVVGSKPLPRTQVVKKLWEYIKKNNLQDKKNRRNINADASLKPIFGKAQVSMFEMTKLVSKHLS